MNTHRLIASPQSHAPEAGDVRPSFRTKTVATRLTPDELAEIESAAESAG